MIKSGIRSALVAIVPQLGSGFHKGQAGRVGVIGGSFEYTGAPYFAAIAALKTGADLVHVFCSEAAATPIKSYSPELIVHPVFKADSNTDEIKKSVSKVEEVLERLHVLVLGPGLGREESMLRCVKEIIGSARKREMPMVLDGDALFLISRDPGVIRGYKKAILTPNHVEYKRLRESVLGAKDDVPKEKAAMEADLKKVCAALDGVVVMKKGDSDMIGTADVVVDCDDNGGPRRCGGQGDILAGASAVFVHWAYESTEKISGISDLPPLMLGAYGAVYMISEALIMLAAASLTRACSRAAYNRFKRSMTASDMVAAIGEEFERQYPAPTEL